MNLLDPIGSYGWAYGEAVPKADDNVKGTFKDLKKGTVVEWDTSTVQLRLFEIEKDENYFVSDLAEEKYGAATNKFSVTHMRFASPSEHAHNGEYYDLEL